MIELIESIATIVASIIVGFAAAFAFKQLKIGSKANQLNSFTNLVKIVQGEEIREARGFIFKKLENIKYKYWNDEDKENAEKVCHTYDTIGIMLKNGLINIELLRPWRYSVSECWKIVKPLVEDYRTKRGNDFWTGIEYLAEKLEIGKNKKQKKVNITKHNARM